jgi:drug/metabolite transporter (DMT)-like permease
MAGHRPGRYFVVRLPSKHVPVRRTESILGIDWHVERCRPALHCYRRHSHCRRIPERRVIAGLAIGLTGAGLIAWPTIHEGQSSVVGVLLILPAIVSYGFALNLARPLQQQYGALPVVLRSQAVAVMLTAPLGVPDLLAARWTPAPFFSLLMLGVFGTGIAFVLLATAAGRVGTTRASSAAFLIPPVALLLGVLIRDEYVATLSIIGSAVCVAGASLMRRAQISPRHDVKTSQSSPLVCQKCES